MKLTLVKRTLLALAIALGLVVPMSFARTEEAFAEIGSCGITGTLANSKGATALDDGGDRIHVYSYKLTAPCTGVDVLASYNVRTGRAAEGVERNLAGRGAAQGVWTCDEDPWLSPVGKFPNCQDVSQEITLPLTFVDFAMGGGEIHSSALPLSALALSNSAHQVLKDQIQADEARLPSTGAAPKPQAVTVPDCTPHFIDPKEPVGQTPETPELVIELVSKPSAANPRTVVFKVTNTSPDWWGDETVATVRTRCAGNPSKLAREDDVANPREYVIENLDPGQSTTFTYDLLVACNNFQVLAQVTPAKNYEGAAQPFEPTNKHQAVYVNIC